MIAANDLDVADLASAIFTATHDLTAVHPALAARKIGWHHVPLLSAAEIAVPDSIPDCIRVLLHWNTDRPPFAINHVYLRDAVQLRPDLHVDEDDLKPKPAAVATTRAAVGIYGGGPVTVAYQGAPATNSQEAIFQHFGPQVDTLACHSFEDIFTAVEGGAPRWACCRSRIRWPVRSIRRSTCCSITTCAWSAKSSSGYVIACSRRRRDDRRHPSRPLHPQHCPGDATSRPTRFGGDPAYDTAGTAKSQPRTPNRTPPSSAALTGQAYNLDLLASGIEDSPKQHTVLLVGHEEPRRPHDSLHRLRHAAHAGALYHVLGELADRDIDLTRSKPPAP